MTRNPKPETRSGKSSVPLYGRINELTMLCGRKAKQQHICSKRRVLVISWEDPRAGLFVKLKRLKPKETAQMLLAYLIVVSIFATPIVGVRVFLSLGTYAILLLIICVSLGLVIVVAFRIYRKNTGDAKIPTDTEEVRARKIALYGSRGETSVFIYAEIDREGTFILSGQDVGKSPEQFWGDTDYEYWIVLSKLPEEFWNDTDYEYCIVISKEHKDRLRHALTEREFEIPMASWWKAMFPLFRTVYEGLAIEKEKFAQFLRSEEIPFEEKSGVIENDYKGEVVIALMQRAFGGKLRANRKFLEFLSLNRIPYRFDPQRI